MLKLGAQTGSEVKNRLKLGAKTGSKIKIRGANGGPRKFLKIKTVN